MAYKIIGIILLVVVAAFLQGVNFYIFGVKPNWALAVFLALAFVADFWFYLVMEFSALIVLRFQPAFSWELGALAVIIFLVFIAARQLPWKESINFLFLTFASPTLFYLLVNPKFLYFQIGIFLIELFYNLLLGLTVFFILKNYAPKSRFRF